MSNALAVVGATSLPSFLVLILGFWTINVADAAGGDCMSGSTIDCFECNSWDDPRCHDPFNFTIYKKDMPRIRECEGCCVKMVQFIGTEYYQVKRTCTDDFDVNFFMVNHACMTEGHRHGHMCFCEEDECNHSTVTAASRSLTVMVLTTLLTIIGGASASVS